MADKKIKRIRLIQSDEKPTNVEGELVIVSIVDASIKELSESKKMAARLCGSDTTCMALIDLEDE